MTFTILDLCSQSLLPLTTFHFLSIFWLFSICLQLKPQKCPNFLSNRLWNSSTARNVRSLSTSPRSARWLDHKSHLERRWFKESEVDIMHNCYGFPSFTMHLTYSRERGAPLKRWPCLNVTNYALRQTPVRQSDENRLRKAGIHFQTLTGRIFQSWKKLKSLLNFEGALES